MENVKNQNYKTTKTFNGETVSYALTALISLIVLLGLKQLFKVFLGVPVTASVITAFVIAQLISYLLEKRFVFRKAILSSNLKQILLFVFRAAVNFGFFKLSDTLFGGILKMQDSFVWLVSISMSFFFNYFFDRTLLFDCAYDAGSVRKSKIYKAFFTNRFVLFSGLLAAVCIAIIYIIYKVFPFGDSTVMRMDLYHQYGPLFAELYDRVVNHESFIYSWTSGGGSSFLGNYFNYLSSPLSVIIFFFDKKDISFAISFLVSIKCVLSACTFTYYLKKSQLKHSYMSAVFGVFYAFSAYFLAYYWNVMWLDGMILLPLIALGIETIINKGNGNLYIISLALLFVSSYYMGFMCCIFAVLYFIAYYLISSNINDVLSPEKIFDKKYSLKALYNNKFINRGVRFAAFSIISAMLCAVTLIPTFIILRSSSATSDNFPSTFESYFNIFDFITSHLAGLETTIRSSGDDVLPNVYSGMLAAILLPLFIVNKNIKLKEKAVYIVLMLIFLFSFDNNCLNFIWHAFHFPNDLPFRFSYIYSFILLVVGYKAISKIRSLEIRDISFVGILWVFFIVLAQKMSTTKMMETTIYTSIAFVIIWTGYLCLVKNGKADKVIVSALAVLICFSEVLIADTQAILITQSNASYTEHYNSYTEAIDRIKADDDSFFRQELCRLETRMDPCYFGYNGMSTFSSMAYEDYSQLQYSLGMFGNRINSYTYNTQTPVYNMMFNIKYLLQTDVSIAPSENLYHYKFTTSDEKTNVYENKYFLPIAFAANENIELWDTSEGNPFEVQEDFFELATGFSGVFKEVEFLDTNYDNVSGDKIAKNGTYWFSKYDADSSYAYADITITPVKNGNIYLYVKSPDISSIDISSTKLGSHTQNIDEPYILDCGYYEVGEELKLSIDCGGADVEECYADIFAYTVDEDVLTAGYERLKNNSIDITSYSDTKITGKINVTENSYLYSSIPYDESWSIYIDGEKSDTFKIGTSMLGTSIKQGEHTVEYRYSPRGLKYGIIISVAAFAGVGGYLIYTKLKKKEVDKLSS